MIENQSVSEVITHPFFQSKGITIFNENFVETMSHRPIMLALNMANMMLLIKKGVYLYDPDYAENQDPQDFTEAQKEVIFKNDDYKCVICGLGRADGLEIHADHILPRSRG